MRFLINLFLDRLAPRDPGAIRAENITVTMQAHRDNFALPEGAIEVKIPAYVPPHIQVKKNLIENRRALVSKEAELVGLINRMTAELQSTRKAVRAIDTAGEVLVSSEAPYDTHEVMSHNSMSERDDSAVNEDNASRLRAFAIKQAAEDDLPIDIEELEADIKASLAKDATEA